VDFYLLPEGHVGHPDFLVEQGDAPVGINQSPFAEAEDILERHTGFGEGEGSEKVVAQLHGADEAETGDLSSGGMDLVVAATHDLFLQEAASFFRG